MLFVLLLFAMERTSGDEDDGDDQSRGCSDKGLIRVTFLLAFIAREASARRNK